MKAFAVALVVVAAMVTVGAVPGFAATSVTTEHTISRTASRDDVEPCRDGKPPAPGERCRGPVKDESGGGGTALTIVISVVVGLGIATAAFIVLRRQLATHHPADGATPAPTTGEQP